MSNAKVDKLLIGGAMVFTFYRVLGEYPSLFTPCVVIPSPPSLSSPLHCMVGFETGHSLVEESLIPTCVAIPSPHPHTHPPSYTPPSPTPLSHPFPSHTPLPHCVLGFETGHSLVEESLIPTCDELMKEAEQRGIHPSIHPSIHPI